MSSDEQSIRSDDEDNRSVRSGSGNERSRSEAEDKKKDEEEKKPKKKRTGPPRRMVLHEDDLTGKGGLVKLQEMFKNFSFRGKGFEKPDLDLMLHKYEQWTHVLFPKQPFAQVVERIEFLGMKRKTVKVHLKKIRMGMTGLDSERIGDDDDNMDDEIPPDFSTELETSNRDRMQPENSDTWSRLATQHLPKDNNEDEFPNEEDLFFDDNDDDIFASIDTGEGTMELLPSASTKPLEPPSSGTSKARSRHSSSSSSSSRSSTSSRGSTDIDDELLKRPTVTGSQNSVRSSASSSITSSSVASSRRSSKAARDSPQSSRSSVSVPKGKKKSSSQRSRGNLKAILEDSDSDSNSRATLSRKSVSDDDEDSNDDVVIPRKSTGKRVNTVNSSDDEDDIDRILLSGPIVPVANKNSTSAPNSSPAKQPPTKARTPYRRIVCSDSDDEGPDSLLQRAETIAISQPGDRDGSPAPSNASSSESKGSKRKRSTKNIHDQTTLPLSGATQKSMMTSDQSDASEADSRSGHSEKGKRPRIGSSDEESIVPSPKASSRSRPRLVSDSDED